MSISIANRILLGFAILISLTVLLGVYSLNQIGVVRDAANTIVTRDLDVMRQLDGIRDSERAMREARQDIVYNYMMRQLGRAQGNSDEAISNWRRRAGEAEVLVAEATNIVNGYRAQAVSPDRIESWRRIGQRIGEITQDIRQMREQTDRQIAAITANDLGATEGAEQGLSNLEEAFGGHLAGAREAVNGGILAGQKRADEIYDDSRLSIWVALAMAALVAIIISYAIRLSITRPLNALMAFVERVGHGDLAGQVAETGRDEFGRLGETLNGMVSGLRQLARQSREATENLNAAAAEIRASTQEQSASVEEQFAAVQETAATVDEITHAGVQIGKRAQDVIAAAQLTAQTSSGGLRAVEDTAQSMDKIREQAEAVAENIVALSEKTQAIGEIIATVNDISERSHLLALNAAIEAAAAGESGRSFAVVAAEMKLLADQAKEATTQVRAILGDIQRGINTSVMLTEEAVKRVTEGKGRTDSATHTIEEISARVQESVQTFQQIVASTNQQQLGIEQVMGALQNIRQASQQTASGTRQLDAAAGNLSELSQQLLVLVDRYRL